MGKVGRCWSGPWVINTRLNELLYVISTFGDWAQRPTVVTVAVDRIRPYKEGIDTPMGAPDFSMNDFLSAREPWKGNPEYDDTNRRTTILPSRSSIEPPPAFPDGQVGGRRTGPPPGFPPRTDLPPDFSTQPSGARTEYGSVPAEPGATSMKWHQREQHHQQPASQHQQSGPGQERTSQNSLCEGNRTTSRRGQEHRSPPTLTQGDGTPLRRSRRLCRSRQRRPAL